jgi:BMFP domain-containing protein YqiC
MADRPRFFDDLAGVAGGAFSALAGLREEVESTIRARVEEAIRRLDLVKREDLEAVQELAANARAGQEAATAKIAALEARLAKLEGAPAPVAERTAPLPADVSANGPEAAPAAMPPGSGAPGSSSSPTGVA